MKEQELISPEKLLQVIKPLSTALYESFAEAIQLARPYFSDRLLPVEEDNTLLSCLVRFEVKHLLIKNGVAVTDDEETEYKDLSMEELALIGLAGFYKGYHFKVRKSPDGALPVPTSQPAQDFYGQQLPMRMPDLPDVIVEPIQLNIIILWRFDQSRTNIGLTVVVPRSGGRTRRSVKEYYRVDIPHPVTTIKAPELRADQPPIEEPPITIKETETVDDKNDIRRADTAS